MEPIASARKAAGRQCLVANVFVGFLRNGGLSIYEFALDLTRFLTTKIEAPHAKQCTCALLGLENFNFARSNFKLKVLNETLEHKPL